jgi:hypothetical protein
MPSGWRGSYTRYREFFLNISALYKKRADLRAFLEVILSLTTIIIFLLFALKPTAITIIDLIQQIKTKQATLAALTQKVNNLQIASGLLQQNQNFIPDIDTAVPSFPKPDVLSQQVLGLAAKDSVEMPSFAVNQVSLVGIYANIGASEFGPLPGNAMEMPFSLSVRGTYPNLISFIKDLENLRTSVKIDSLSIGSSATDNGLVIVAVISGREPFLGK